MKTKSIKKIVFLDVDGTLINSYKGPNSKNFTSTFEEIQQKGVLLSLNSNRSIEDLLPIIKQFKIKGPIVVENGAYIYFPQNGIVHEFISRNEKKKMKAVRKKVVKLFTAFFEERGIDVEIETIDTSKKLMSNSERINNSSPQVRILNNKYRKYTVSAHIQEKTKNSYKKSRRYIKKLEQFLIKELSDTSDLVIKGHPFFCNILVYSSNLSKKTGVQKLADMYPNATIAAVGDEYGDVEMIKDTGDFYAVANADKKAREAAIYVSKENFTKGVLDILKKISL